MSVVIKTVMETVSEPKREFVYTIEHDTLQDCLLTIAENITGAIIKSMEIYDETSGEWVAFDTH